MTVDPMTGRTIGNYRVIAKVGEGGMGKVYRAVDTMVEREVALKSLKPEIAAHPGIVERFRSEAVLLAKLNHPAIAHLYTFFKDGEQYFMAMEYVAGDTLQALIHNNGTIPYTRALVLQGVGHAHSMGILHRDLKPANLMLTPAEKVKIMDFGIARVLGGTGVTRHGRVMGTPEYLAPERIRGKQDDPRSDLYSVGVVLFQMLTGRLPFEAGSEYDMLTAQVQARPPRPREIGVSLPPDVEDLVMRALEKDPDRRYASAVAFEMEVAAAQSGAGGTGSHVSTHELRVGGRAGAIETGLSNVPAAETRLMDLPKAQAQPGAFRPTVAKPMAAAPAVVSSMPSRGPDTPLSPVGMGWMDRTPPVLYDKRAAALVAGLAVALAVGTAWFAYRHKPVTPPKPAVTAAVANPAPAPAAKPVEPNADAAGATGAAGETAPEPAVPGGSGPSPMAPGTKPAPAPEKKPAPDKRKPKPRDPPATPPAISPVPMVTPEARRAAIAALDQTDGPAAGEPRNRPIHLAGMIAALKAGGPAMAGEFEDAVGRRGVNFQLTSARAETLRAAGAPDALLKLIEGNYRGKGDVVAAANSADAPAPKPVNRVKRIWKLGEARSLFVECEQPEIRDAVRDEFQKQLGSRIKLMDARTGADVVMKVTLTSPNGWAVSGVLGPKDRAQVRATVLEPVTGSTLWEQGAGDHKPIVGIIQGDSLKRLASRIVKELKDAVSKS
jgi:serine/threonine-protein kinase